MPRPKSEIPWLERRGNGKFYVHWYDAGARRTQRQSLHTTDLDEAKARFAAFLSEGGDVVRGAPGLRLTVASAVGQYLKEHADVKCAAADRQHDAAKHLVNFFGETPMADVDIPLSRAYASYRTAARETVLTYADGRKPAKRKMTNGASPATVKRELGMLLAAAHHAANWKRMPPEHVPKIEYPDVPKHETEFLTPGEVRELMGAATGRLRSFIVLAYFTAARRRAIERLEIAQVRLDQARAYLHKSGEKQTGKRKAVVPLNEACAREARLLIAMADDRQQYLLGHMERVNGRWQEIVPSFYRPFRKLCERLGLPEGKRHPHILRHSRATHLLQSGQDLWSVANLLGDTIKTTEDRYGHHTPEHAASAVSRWDESLVAGLG